MTSKRPSSCIDLAGSKKPRLQQQDEASQRQQWSRYRDDDGGSNLSTLTEASDNDPPELSTSIHVAAGDVDNLEQRVDCLASELQSWSLCQLRQWRQQKQTTRQRQKAAKHKLMRVLQQSHEDTMQEE